MSINPQLETRIERLETALQEMNARLAKLEHKRVNAEPALSRFAPAGEPAPRLSTDKESYIALAGVSVLILGGAFVIRALTESATIPKIAGIALGLAYAAFWIWRADRLTRRGRRGAALFDTVTAGLIAFPLIWETTVRFRILPAAAASAILAAIAVLFVVVAWRSDYELLLWVGNIGSIIAAFAIGAGTNSLLVVSAIGGATMIVSFSRKWRFAPWLPAVASNILALAVIATKAINHTPGDIAVPLLLFALLWLAPIAGRRLSQPGEPTLFEMAQTANALLIGVGGAAFFASPTPLGLLCVICSAGAYAVAFSRTAATLFFQSIGTYFAAIGIWLLAPTAAVAAMVWGVIGVAAAEISRRRWPRAAAVQSALWIVAAAIAGSVVMSTLGALVGRGSIDVPISVLAVGLMAIVAFIRVSDVRVASVALLAVFVCVVISGAIAIASGRIQEPAILALARTGVLAATATALALAGRWLHLREGPLLARALLVIGGLKLIAEDVRVARAAILVVAFALYGGAMLVVAKIGVTYQAAPRGQGTTG